MFTAMSDTFFEAVLDVDRDLETNLFEPARSLVALDGPDIVATAGIVTRQLSVPGAIVPMAGVTYVTVAPTHRRRGVLRHMMARQLSELHEQGGEPVAGLWASESAIYQRFGYGSAAPRAVLSGPTPLPFRAGTDIGTGRVRRLPVAQARPPIQAVYERLRPQAVGHLDRSDAWWDKRLADPEHHRFGATENRYLVYEELDGQVSGFAVYRVKLDFGDSGPDGLVQILDLSATTPAATAALWRFVLDLDLVRRFRRRMCSAGEPLTHLVVDPRAVQTQLTDALWIRLVDVDRALSARRYQVDVDLVLEVSDEFCPWNAGRWRLAGGPEGATVVATTEAADLSLSSTELGTAYLGGPTLLSLAGAGRVRELTSGSLQRASLAMGWATVPWCPEVF